MTSQTQKHHASRGLDDLITQRAQKLKKHRKQFWKLIHLIRANTGLLSPCASSTYNNPSCAKRVVDACERMARRRHHWQRFPEAWSAPAASPFVQLRSLVQHLFDRYPVPNFMAPVWWSEKQNHWELSLYLYLATGRSVRQFSGLKHLPITKRMAALFMQAPDDLRPIETFRWAQILSLGGDARLARILINQTHLWAPTADEAYWQTVILFLIQNQPLSAAEIVEIVRFIHEQRYEPAEIVWGRGAGDDPVQPDFSLRGRTLMSLRRHQANWRSELIEKGFMPPPHINPLDFPWAQSEIGSFHLDQEGTLWSIEELLTPRQLRTEGRIMQHCVTDYISACARRKTTIWSMKYKTGRRRRRTLTIEVLPKTKVILQASGKQNCTPGDDAKNILRRWAKQEGLQYQEQA